ncbi:hypothetical protein USDA257_p01290 (plasmid) [Sinorhizobium fredii USDA 257]|uniref:Uncharacterized protein n=1 Tax=Sinorhizobium fredii (strain USDA 257) TaxID=1185652 RepID=I3XG40_SINF2|nr:hypothetical protein USDA257_p01290 [Sinorhizobium fredii USDA 257]
MGRVPRNRIQTTSTFPNPDGAKTPLLKTDGAVSSLSIA